MSTLTFDRGNGPVEYTIEQGDWWISWLERDIQYNEQQLAYARFGGVSLPDEQHMKLQISQKTLFDGLSPDELRVVLGYCSHISEHGREHTWQLVLSMVECGADYSALRSLNVELDECLAQIECAGVTGRAVFAFLDEHES